VALSAASSFAAAVADARDCDAAVFLRYDIVGWSAPREQEEIQRAGSRRDRDRGNDYLRGKA
jgi:hypothetical protein